MLVISTRNEFSYALTAVNLHSHPMSLYVSSPIRDSILSFSDEVYKLTGSITQEIGEFGISFHATDLITGLVSRELSPTILFCTCPLLAQCSLSPQQTLQAEFYNLSCGCEKGINITEGHSCITSKLSHYLIQKSWRISNSSNCIYVNEPFGLAFFNRE